MRALVYRAELAVAMDLPDEALPPLAALHDEPLDDAGRAALAPEPARASELARELAWAARAPARPAEATGPGGARRPAQI